MEGQATSSGTHSGDGSERTGAPAHVWPAVGLALSVGLLEWLRAGGLHASPGDAIQAVPAIVALYGAAGLLAAAVSVALGRGGAMAMGLLAGALAAATLADGAERRLMWLASISLGLGVAWGVLRLVRALPWLASKRLWALAATLPLALSVAAPLRHAPGPVRSGTPPPDAPSILLVSIDTLRADALGAYGGAGAHTPFLDALARQGVLFRVAIAPSVYTGPSHAALLTGLHPSTTGFVVNYMGLSPEFPTLAETLGARGYTTAAFPSSWTTTSRATNLPIRFQVRDEELRQYPWLPVLAMKPVLLRPLRRWLKSRTTWPPYRPAGATSDRVVHWLASRPTLPFFAWVHYFDPHVPYRPPPELAPEVSHAAGGAAAGIDGSWYRLSAEARRALVTSPARVARMRALYAAEVSYVDRELARVVAAARAAAPGGLWTVVTADHGESMGEHGIYWNRDLYDVSLHVPLIIVPPGPASPRQVASPVRLIDIVPTLLAAVGVEAPRKLDGRSLIPLLAGQEDKYPVPARSLYVPEEAWYRAPAKSLRTRHWKLIARGAGWQGTDHWQSPRSELYDLEGDPGERRDLSAALPERRDTLARQLAKGAGGAPAVRRALSQEERAQLRALGYLK